MKRWLFTILLVLGWLIYANASVLLEEDFEYGQTEAYPGDGSDCTNSIMVSSGPWDEVGDSRCHADKYGEFSIVDVNGVPFTDTLTGNVPEGSYVLRMYNKNTGDDQCTAHLLKNSLSLGTEWWLQFWFARARVTGEMSATIDFHDIKFPYCGNANCDE